MSPKKNFCAKSHVSAMRRNGQCAQVPPRLTVVIGASNRVQSDVQRWCTVAQDRCFIGVGKNLFVLDPDSLPPARSMPAAWWSPEFEAHWSPEFWQVTLPRLLAPHRVALFIDRGTLHHALRSCIDGRYTFSVTERLGQVAEKLIKENQRSALILARCCTAIASRVTIVSAQGEEAHSFFEMALMQVSQWVPTEGFLLVDGQQVAVVNYESVELGN